jgi:hypothetical protein
MLRLIVVAIASFVVTSTAMAQTPGAPANASAEQVASLNWMQGVRVHTNADGSKVLEAFLGPVNGVVTGTALSAIGTDGAFTEYHRIGPNPDGVYGLDVANTRGGMKWNFTPLKAIAPDKITFQSVDGKLTISYADDGSGGIIAQVDRVGADGAKASQTWQFKPVG